MGIERTVAESPFDDPNRMGGTSKAPPARKKSKLDSDKMRRLHAKLMAWYVNERDKQSYNREQMAIDEAFYDGMQWSEEDAQALMERGQAPLVFNKLKPTVNWLLGTERRTRVDGKVLPREENDEQGAEVKSKLLKHLSDVNRLPFARSQAWAKAVIGGLGWLEDGISPEVDQELLYSRCEDWRHVYHDSSAKELDLSDGRYLFRFKWVDLDVAVALAPQHEHKLKSAAVNADAIGMDDDELYYLGSRVSSQDLDYARPAHRSARHQSSASSQPTARERVKLIEAWYRVPKHCKVCRGGDYHGAEFDATNPEMVAAVDSESTQAVPTIKMEMRCALMTEDYLLYEGPSPYRHNRFPLTPVWCYRRHGDNLPYSIIRDLRDPQEDYNKRASKALFILSTNRVIMDADAHEDIELIRSEAARPDSVFAVKKGSRFELAQDKQLAEEHLMLMDRDAQLILDTGGVTEQNLGQDNKGLSGKAINSLQDQGTVVTAPLFDNLRLAIQMQSEVQLALIEQFYTMPKVVRIVGENQPIEWLPVNTWDETSGRFINDITASKADYIVDEQDFRASLRQAMFESMMELIGKLPPEVGMQMLDMVIDFADVPNKTEIVARIRKLNGERDPSRKPTPEEEQQMAQQAQDAEVQKQQMMALQQAQIDKIVAEVAKNNATALKEAVTAAFTALQAGQIVGMQPSITPVADAILEGAGYKDQGGQDPNIPAIQQLQQQVLPAQGQPIPGQPAPQQTEGATAGSQTATPTDNFQPGA